MIYGIFEKYNFGELITQIINFLNNMYEELCNNWETFLGIGIVALIGIIILKIVL